MTDSSPRPRAGHVVVIGGGIAGLAAAHRLLQEAPFLQVTLIEAAARLGGKISTEQIDGFVIEAGPDSFLASKPRGVGLSEELGLGDRLQGVTPRQKRAFVLYDDRLHELPEGLTGLVPTRLGPLARSSLLSPMGKARIALDYLLPARREGDDESLGAFVRRRLGHEAWERLVEPLMAGIYGGNGDQLSLAATFPQLRDVERKHGGLIRGVLAARAAAPSASRPRSAFLKPAGGLSELVVALEGQIREGGSSIMTDATVREVIEAHGGYVVQTANGERLPADAVIVATPAFAAAETLAGVDPALARELEQIPYASSAIVTLAYKRDQIAHPLDAHGYIVPRAAGGPILACTWTSRKWANTAPEGWELVRVFLGRAGAGDVDLANADDAILTALAQREVERRLGTQGAPSLVRVQRWPDGMPQYVMGHPERVARMEQALRSHPGLLLAGAAYHGVGLPDCIASGERAAAAALAHLRATTARTDSPGLAATPTA